MTCPIAWCDFSWEAAAGFSAVVAAVIVGLRQVGIANRQIELAEQANRVSLFELRFGIFERTQRFVTKSQTDKEFDWQGWTREFAQAQNEAVFLFDERVQMALEEIWQNSVALDVVRRKMRHDMEDQREYDKYDIEQENKLLKWLSKRLNSLSELFEVIKISGNP
jgi:hypothetical protein